MSQIESLTKTLTQIVGSLQELISKKGVSQESRETPKLKKTPDMTYSQFLRLSLANRLPVQVKSKYASFALQEDLQLLYDLNAHSQISIKTFEEISKSRKINRPTESLRSRYHDYLYMIDEKQLKKIVAWIQRQGVNGYLVFEGDEIRLQMVDPKESIQQRKRLRAKKHEAEIKRQQRAAKQKKSNLPPAGKQLGDILKLYSAMTNMPVKTLSQKLQQLSGDISDLDAYIQTKDARILWTPEEDEALRRGGPQVQVLKRYKTEKKVQARRKYLGIA